MAGKSKSPKQCAEAMLKKGGNSARAIRYAAGVGAGFAVRNPRAAIAMARGSSKPKA